MRLITRLGSTLLVAAFSLNGYCTGPDLPVGLDLLNGWAAGQIGMPPIDCDDADLPDDVLGRHHSPWFPWSDGAVEVDLDKIQKVHKVHTPQAFGVLVQFVLLHEYMHAAGYGMEGGGDGWAPKFPSPWIPSPADCEHFHMSAAILHILCDAAANWTPPANSYEQDVLDELCSLYQQYRATVDSLRSSFAGCGVIPAKLFSGGFEIPEFDPGVAVPDCAGC